MRDFIISNITGGVKAPFSKRSLEHVNEMTSELGAFLFESANDYSSFGTELVIVKGAVISGSMPGAITWTAGIIYYQGDFYRVDAGGVTINVGETAVWNYVDTYITGDPATYSDTNTYNQHRIRKMRLTSGASGSGLKNYDSVKLYTKESNSTSYFGTPSYSAPVNGVLVDNMRYYRQGRRVIISGTLEVSNTGNVDEITFTMPISETEDYPDSNLQVYYDTSLNMSGVCVGVPSTNSQGLSGYIVANATGGNLIFSACLASGATVTTWKVKFKAEYYTSTPFISY